MDTTPDPKDYVIDQVGWHTRVQGNPESKAAVDRRFRLLFSFLSTNGLLASAISVPLEPEPLEEAFCIRLSHLTKEGSEVMSLGYEKWLAAIDRGTAPEKSKALENALSHVKGQRQ